MSARSLRRLRVDWADQLRAWLPDGYDPDVFTADQVNQQLQIGPRSPD
jgi:hypothetical protein